MSSFASLVGASDFSGAVRLLDAEIDQTSASYAAMQHRLVQLHLNRGICNQKLQLNRKALKVGGPVHGTQARAPKDHPCQFGRLGASAVAPRQALVWH